MADAQAQQKTAGERLAQASAALGSVRDARDEASKAAAGAKAAFAAALADVPDELRVAEALEAEAAQLSATLDQGRASHDIAIVEERRTSDALKAAELSLGHLHQVSETRRQEARHYAEAFTAALTAAHLDAIAYDVAKADIEQLAGVVEQIDAHAQNLTAAQDRLNRANTSVIGVERPDLGAARDHLLEAEAALDLAVERVTTQGVALQQAEATHQAVSIRRAELEQAESAYGVVGALAQLADGGNAQKLRLRDYAIAATFDQVLGAANVRFARMSRNRYTLLRKLEVGDGRFRSGLEIEVYDVHTDQRRDAHTLSGGEGFLASLSLALGLSDIVQAEAGGVKLDAIFIDEGFGHLDNETLDVALATLRDLVGRDRAVGVISHVDVVKDQIPQGFDVIRQARGSVVVERQVG